MIERLSFAEFGNLILNWCLIV